MAENEEPRGWITFSEEKVVQDEFRNTPQETRFEKDKAYFLPRSSCLRWKARGAAFDTPVDKIPGAKPAQVAKVDPPAPPTPSPAPPAGTTAQSIAGQGLRIVPAKGAQKRFDVVGLNDVKLNNKPLTQADAEAFVANPPQDAITAQAQDPDAKQDGAAPNEPPVDAKDDADAKDGAAK